MKNKVTRKSLLRFITIIVSLCVICTYLGQTNVLRNVLRGNSTIPQEDMFKVIYINDVLKYHVVYDVETNVEYVLSTGSNNRGAFTMLVDSTGKPKLYKR